MAKKINPTSFRIGTQLQWDQSLQTYGFKKSTQNLRGFIKTNPVISYSQNSNTPTFVSRIKTKISPNKQVISIFFYTKSPKQISKTQYTTPLIWHSLANKLYPYNYSFISSATIVANYALFLFKNQVPLRRILTFLNNLLLPHLSKYSKLVVSKYGTQLFLLKGFQFSISGRFESSSNQMSKTLKQTVGTLPLVSLEHYVEFACIPLFFKLGKCNLKIWFFYSKIT